MRRLLDIWKLVGPLCAVVLGLSTPALAQPRERQAAAEAYDRGTAAYVAGDYEDAAQWYESAHRHLPTAEALVQAARSYDKAGKPDRAATLALALLDRYPDHQVAGVVAEELLSAHRNALLLLHVSCADCSLEVDGHLQGQHDFFVLPNTSHMLVAGFPDAGQATRALQGSPGEELSVPLEPPSATPVAVATSDRQDSDRKPLDPMFTYAGAGVTAALLVLSVGLSADAVGGVDDYENATAAYRECTGACEVEKRHAQQLLDDGQRRERRANIAWAATAVSAAATAAVALFLTDWDRESDSEQSGVQLGLAPDRQLGVAARLEWSERF